MKKKLGHWTFYIYDQSSQSMLLCIALAIFTSTCKQQCDFYCLCMCVAATLRHAVCFMTVLWWSQAWTAIRVKFCHISSFCTDGNPISLILLWSHLTLTHIFHAMLEKSKAYCPAGMGDRQWCPLPSPTNQTASSFSLSSLPPSPPPPPLVAETDFPEIRRGRLRWWICSAEACLSLNSTAQNPLDRSRGSPGRRQGRPQL